MSPAADGERRDGGGVTVEVEHLVKRYPGRRVNAVDGVSFAVARGEIFGLLGPNGAGKTTTIGVLTTRVRPTAGRALIDGIDVARDPVAAKRRIAVVPQRVNLDRSLTARQNLLFHAAYFGIARGERERRANELLAEFGLADRGGDSVDNYSGGQAQRLMIARALMHEPAVLFLDEPTTGLDPQARLFVWDRVRDLRRSGVTVVLTTHDMDEAAELADRVAIMDRGTILALDTPERLTATIPGRGSIDVTLSDSDSNLAEELTTLSGVERFERVQDNTGERLRLYARHDVTTLIVAVTRAFSAHGSELRDLRIGRPTLEDVFIHHTGRALR
ncbi:MAG TPA: ABC transporter ATP-binding protein [Candidatus Sulfotelmatobacter sp.]|nr:ABC transporter ATP-binding protein [Candidatus Sulfotelmatobacter sp.]